MTNRDKKIMNDLVNAARNATAYFNGKAQGQLLGLNQRDDDLRQELCNAVSAALGTIYCGNLQRTSEAQSAIDHVNSIED